MDQTTRYHEVTNITWKLALRIARKDCTIFVFSSPRVAMLEVPALTLEAIDRTRTTPAAGRKFEELEREKKPECRNPYLKTKNHALPTPNHISPPTLPD